MNWVECLSSASYPGTPTAFTWEGERCVITEIIARGRSPQGHIFRVRTTGGLVFELTYDEATQAWQITPFLEDQ